jgi:uncharacterized protein
MIEPTTLFIAIIFVVGGITKGVIGLGLPVVAMGLLALVMAPVDAAALLVLPSIVTNVWQMLAGPSLRPIAVRLWPMMIGVCLGTWAGAGLIDGAHARHGTALLGAALFLYAVAGLVSVRFTARRDQEPWLGPLTGAVTGLVTAATGVFAIPAVAYLQAIGLEKEELVQALGLSFTVSTLALSVNLAQAGALKASIAGPALAALALSCAGVWIGQAVRLRLTPATFKRWFLIGLLILGAHLVVRSVA